MSILADFQFGQRLRRTLRRLSVVVCPPDAEAMGIADELVDRAELFVRALSPAARAAVVLGTQAFEWLAVCWPGAPGRPFSAMSPEDAQRYYQSWWDASLPPFHAYAKGVKGMLAIGYYEHPRVREAIGYQPDEWIAQVTRERLQRFAADIAAHEGVLRAPDPLLPPRAEGPR